MKRRALVPLAALAGFAVAIAGCGGGASLPASTSHAPTATKTARATLTIVIPPKATPLSDARKPAYISPDTNSIAFLVTGMGSPQVVAFTSSNCTIDDGTKTCTAGFAAPIGAETMQVQTFESADGSGTPLSTNSVPITITAGQTNTPMIVLNGVAATIGVTLSPASMQSGTTATISAAFVAYDAAGDAIVGPGSIIDADSDPVNPTLTSDDTSGATAIGAVADGSWPITETNPPSGTITFTVSASGFASATATLTVSGTAPTPTPDAVANGTFATGTLAPWYRCYAPRYVVTSGANSNTLPVNASPAPLSYDSSNPSGGPTPVPSTTSANDVSIQQTTPSGALPPSGDTNFARAGYDMYAYDGVTYVFPPDAAAGEMPYGATPKGMTGICQDVVLPSNSPTLSFYVFEGGNDSFEKEDDEADIYTYGSFSSSSDGAIASVAPATLLYTQNNCYDSEEYMYNYFYGAWGVSTTTSHVPSATGRYAGCPYYPGGIVPAGGNAAFAGAPGVPDGGAIGAGGVWYLKQLTISGYTQGEQVTLFLGVSSAVSANPPSTGGGEYYYYAFFDDISLTP